MNWTPSFVLRGLVTLRRRSTAPVLLYHANYGATENALIADNVHNVQPDLFVSQVRYLQQHFEIVPLDDIFDACERGSSRRPIAAVTFDDGYRSIFETALPLLEEMAVPSSVFLTTELLKRGAFWRDRVRWVISQDLVSEFLAFATAIDGTFSRVRPPQFYRDTKDPAVISSKLVDDALVSFLDERGATDSVAGLARDAYCTPDQVKTLDSSLVSVGSHTRNHYVLSSISADEQYDEIQSSAAYLSKLGKGPNQVLSIPFGGSGDYTPETLRIIADFGYRGYLLSQNRLNHLMNGDRLRPYGLLPIERFMPPPNMKSYMFRFLK